ncbi:MAG TPA: LPXTG cell wall anchor domain-containing protein [Acidimicrobiia bacterium]|nr:LPXTG cell wall anchor domain-containing protein [Acidimicrobiia bacterium]
MLGAPALATHVEPELVTGNENCEAATGLEEIFRDESNPITSGSHDIDGDGDDDIYITVSGSTFNWSTDEGLLIAAVFVKGGPDGNLYDYRPGGATSDTGLHAPVNPANGQFFGLSHITFCAPDETTTTTEEETTTTTVEETTTTTEEETTTTTVEETTTTTVEETTTTTAEETTTTAEATTTSATVGGIVVTQPSTPQVSQTTASTLPFTGISSGSVAVIGAGMAGLGALLLVASRRGEDKAAIRSWS